MNPAPNVVSAQAFRDWVAVHVARAEAALSAALPASGVRPARLHEAMRYASLDGGKRVRPLLVYAAGELAGGRPDAARELDAAACAVEFVHAYSLVHDDLPCMDDDDLRRGKPTVHRQYDEATAMLVGDALQAQAFAVLGVFRPHALARALPELARAAGSTGMVGGQAIDLAAVGQSMNQSDLEDMHRRKTGAMLAVSLRLGWFASHDEPAIPAALDDYAQAIGLAFQVVDDILDVEVDTQALGKTAGKDAANNKPTFVSLLGLAGARELAEQLRGRAQQALVALGSGSERLADLADLITSRRH